MGTANFQYGKPVMVKYTTLTSWLSGDVIASGNTPLVAHSDNPSFTGGTLTDALAAGGGVYQMTANGAIPLGSYVFYDTVTKKVGVTPSATTLFFGYCIAGPTLDGSGAAPASDGDQCLVFHQPMPFAAVYSPAGQPPAQFRNFIDGGDMTVNPAQRGTSQAADIANTLTYGPDRFAFKGGASSAINWSINADTSVAGFSKSLKWQRKAANTDTAALNMVQVIETADSIRAQGQVVTVSFWAKKGANYSGGNLTVQLETSTGTDQSANNLIAGSWTNQAHVVNGSQALTTTMTRYTFTGTVPSTCTQLGLLFQWTPTGTAGADDSITINGIQVEIGGAASPFEHRDVEVELALCQRYYYRITEQNGINVCMGQPGVGANLQVYTINMPTPMRAAPTVTVTPGGFKLVIDGAAAAAVVSFAAGSVHSPTFINLQTGNTLTAAAHSIVLQGSNTTGLIEASADY